MGSRNFRFAAATLATLVLGATACGRSDQPAVEPAKSAEASRSPGPASGAPPPGALPPGHPPLSDPARPGGMPGLPPAPHPGAGALSWTMPAAWTSVTPTSTMRRAEYRIPGSGGPGECAVFYFGPGQGGDARANADRWAAQFTPPDGAAPGSALKTETLDVAGITVLRVEVAGTYVGGMGSGPSGPAQPDHMLLGAIVAGPDANWFFKCTGPRTTLEAQRAAFDAMLQSIRPAE